MSNAGDTLTRIEMTGLDGEPVRVDAKDLETLSQRVRGTVLRPGDGGFEGAVRIWNGMISKVPACVVQPVSAADVGEAIAFARVNDVLLSIKGGGHNIAGTSLVNGGLTLDMSRMRSVQVDPTRRLVHVGAGCLLGDVDPVTQEHGLATVLGQVSKTGVAGLTLGGGFGYLTRRFGWASDNLEEVEIVTADGRIRRAATDEHDDLFWALHGGGGNFGVVTRFTFRLHEVGPLITGGLIAWDIEFADDVLKLYRDATEAAPRELTLMATIRLAPPAPYIPEPWHGRHIIALIACHTGDEVDAEEDLAPIRSLGKPIADGIAREPYVQLQTMLDAGQPKGLHQYWKSEFLPGLQNELLETYRDHGVRTSAMSQAILFQLGGAAAEFPPDSTPLHDSDAPHVFFAAGCWPPDVPDEPGLAWARSAWAAVRPYSTGGGYINAQPTDEDRDRIQASYRDNMGRLSKIKSIYDPDNLFRVNRNISPVA